MDLTQHLDSDDLLYRRLDEMNLAAGDAARAKATLRNAAAIVDFGFAAAAAIRSSSAYLARHLKAALASAPQH